ncbi:MAG: hypothetical protein JXN63_09170 [Candidatus Delongbacteria bacterium]|nr:hypothetical protein [Candidatus Delongbacteria bacterium]
MRNTVFLSVLFFYLFSFSSVTTWNKYMEVTSDVTIAASDQLIIESGTVVRFAPGVTLTVYGEIKSQGTEADQVNFTALDSDGMEWGGIIIDSPSGVNEFHNTNFSFMTANSGPMTIYGSEVTFTNCRFTNNNSNSYGGALSIISGNVTILDTEFSFNSAYNGGAVYINNDCFNGKNTINIENCSFEHNDAWVGGGALCVEDNEYSAYNMDINITNCVMNDHYTGTGGALLYINKGKIDMALQKCIIYSNSADYGSAIHASFMASLPGNILAQKFSNLLIFKNSHFQSGAVYINMGNTLNPQNLVFTNNNIVYNGISVYKRGKNPTGGLHIISSGNFPRVANCILWGNTDQVGLNNYFIEDATNPDPNNIFWYCDLESYSSGGTNINLLPNFIRSPYHSYPETINEYSYNFHLSPVSPCTDAGDPDEPCFEPNSSIVDIGAYGNTNEASVSPISPPLPGEDLVIPDNHFYYLYDPEGSASIFGTIVLGSNSYLYTNVNIKCDYIYTSNTTKFDGGRSWIINIGDIPVSITVAVSAQIHSVVFRSVNLIVSGQLYPSVTVDNSIFQSDSIGFSEYYSIDMQNCSSIIIENSEFSGNQCGIRVNPLAAGSNIVKASGRITNNTFHFESLYGSKENIQKTGIEVSNSNIDIEYNEINGCDNGIVVKSGSSAVISGNTVKFEPSPATKGFYSKKGIVAYDNSDVQISENYINNNDWESPLEVIGIQVENSDAEILYNKMLFCSWDMGPRTGISLVNPADTVRVINNTLYNPLQAFNITTGAFPVPAEFINNIYWSESGTYITINDTTAAKFINNCFIDATGITGSGNIFADPQINSAWSEDFTLASTSPCINAGIAVDGVHEYSPGKSLIYYGSAPDIGCEEFWEESQVYPANISIAADSSSYTIQWDPVDAAVSYNIYSSDDPYGTFVLLSTTTGTSYRRSSTPARKFFYVTANIE